METPLRILSLLRKHREQYQTAKRQKKRVTMAYHTMQIHELQSKLKEILK